VTGSKDLSKGFVPSGALLKAIMINSGQPLRYQNSDGVFQDEANPTAPNRRYVYVYVYVCMYVCMYVYT
jgi:hypothetical protein